MLSQAARASAGSPSASRPPASTARLPYLAISRGVTG